MLSFRACLQRSVSSKFVRYTSTSTSKKVAADATSEAAKEGGSVAVAVATTFGTYMIADYLSNFIQHPTQNMDYGIFNKVIGRPVDQNFWGTRTEHIVGVAACLAVTDHGSQAAFGSYLGRSLCFAKSPAAFIVHTFVFIAGGVAIYCGLDTMFNPTIEGDRMKALNGELYSTVIGSSTAWFEPYVAPALAKVAGQGLASTWVGSALLPATLAYSTVKGVGWYDWGNAGLSPHELKLNGLSKN